jgi:hypothetical protein
MHNSRASHISGLPAYLQALPYSDRLEGDRGVTEWSPPFLSEVLTRSEAEMTKLHF